ncbi:hypothetical protein TNCV_2150471 [Trichonephila clavipes]|nr:hypothetical protein TNCV_2150471 [Trichonephila clavipes]
MNGHLKEVCQSSLDAYILHIVKRSCFTGVVCSEKEGIMPRWEVEVGVSPHLQMKTLLQSTGHDANGQGSEWRPDCILLVFLSFT